MQLTLINRLKLCYEILTIRSGHAHRAQEKGLSTFQRGYMYGLEDGKLNALSASLCPYCGESDRMFHCDFCGKNSTR